MSHSRSWSPALLVVATALAVAGALPAHAQSDAYPTDVCVAHKLRAAADYCREAVRAWNRGDPSELADAGLVLAREQLARSWDRAEAASLAAGVSCEDTTATSTEMVGVLDAGAEDLAAAIATSEGISSNRGHGYGYDKHHKHDKRCKHDDAVAAERKCESSRNMLAAQACQQLLAADSRHLRHRDTDRDREKLESRRSTANAHLAKQWTTGEAKSCKGGPTSAEAVVAVGDAVQNGLESALVSPRVSTDWTMVTPDAEVPYEGKSLAPTCSAGTPWVFFVKRGTVNKTLMY